MRRVGGALAAVHGHMRRNVIAYLALFFALGGAAYAGVRPLLDQAGSVDSKNISNGSVSKADVGKSAIGPRELTPSLRQKLGLNTPQPQNGKYVGTTSDPADITVVLTWTDGEPQFLAYQSSDSNCFFPPTDGTAAQKNPSMWTFGASNMSDQKTAGGLLDIVSPTEVNLVYGVVTTPGQPHCMVQNVELTLLSNP